MLSKYITAVGLVLLIVALAITPTARAESSEQMELYPCIQCHAAIKPPATTNTSEFHNITLKDGHSGLYCVNCHNPDASMMELHGGVPLRVPGFHNRTQLYDTNKLCAQCHSDIYELYQHGAHGNTTFTCPGGETHIIIGYKGVKYVEHDCPPGTKYQMKPQEPCIVCHDPHDPKFKPLSILPPPSDRPEPPPQGEIVAGGVSTLVAGIALIVLAVFAQKREGA